MCYVYFSLKLLVSNLIIIYQEIRVIQIIWKWILFPVMFLQITLPYGILWSKEKEMFSDLVDSTWDSMYLDVENLSTWHWPESQYDEYHFELPVLLRILCRHCKLHINHYQVVAWPAHTNFSKRAKWFGTRSKQLYSTDRQDYLNKKQNKKKSQFAIKPLHMCFCYSANTQTWSVQRWIIHLSLLVCIDIQKVSI